MSDFSDTRIQFRRGTASEWAAASTVVLGAGEPGYDITNDILKIGNGVDVWADLTSIITQQDVDNAISSIVDAAPETLNTLNELAAAINDNPNFFNEVAYSGGDISQFNNDANYVESDTAGITGASGVNNIIQISQSDYDAIGGGNYDLNTVYFITDAPEINYVASGDNVSKLNNDVGYLTSHPSISAATSSNNSGRTYIQDILLDSNGHVLGLSTATETVVDTNTDTNNYVSSTSFSNTGNTLTLNRQGLSALTQAIGTNASPFGNIKLGGNKISSSESNALYLNRTHANGTTAMAGGTYPDANDGGLVATYGSSHSFSPGQAHMYYNSSTIRLLADTNGVTVYGTFTNNSDATQKENVVPLSGCLDLVKTLNPVSFNFKPEEGLHNRTTVGFIAQEVQQTFSGLPYELGIVREIDYNTLSPSGEMNQKQILGISETNLIAVLTKAVQELTARVEALESTQP